MGPVLVGPPSARGDLVQQSADEAKGRSFESCRPCNEGISECFGLVTRPTTDRSADILVADLAVQLLLKFRIHMRQYKEVSIVPHRN